MAWDAWVHYHNDTAAEESAKGRSKASSERGQGRGGGGGGGKGKGKGETQTDQSGHSLPPRVETHYTRHPDIEDDYGGRHGDYLRGVHGIEILEATGDRSDEEIPTPVDKLHYSPFPEEIRDQLQRRGYATPTPIQMQGWPLLMQGWDLLGVAPTGSGKTLCYLLPLLEHIKVQDILRPQDGCIGLILLPTKELCQQVKEETELWCKYSGSRMSVASCTKGERQPPERGRYEILCASAGRLGSLLKEDKFDIMRASFVVVDEADKLLTEEDRAGSRSGMQSPLEILKAQTRKEKQMTLFTATWEEKDMKDRLKQVILRRGLQVRVGGPDLTACKDVSQYFWCRVRTDDASHEGWETMESRDEALVKAVKFVTEDATTDEAKAMSKVLIFVNAHGDPAGNVKRLVDVINAAAILQEGEVLGFVRQEDGNRWESSSDAAFRSFKDSTCPRPRVLISTDVLSRGFDCPCCEYVINYDMPDGKNAILNYIHRIGRTGRGGRQGFALTLMDEPDLRHADRLHSMLQNSGSDVHIPRWLTQVATTGVGRYWRMWKDQLDQRGVGQASPRVTPSPPASVVNAPRPSRNFEFPLPDFQSEERTKFPPL